MYICYMFLMHCLLAAKATYGRDNGWNGTEDYFISDIIC